MDGMKKAAPVVAETAFPILSFQSLLRVRGSRRRYLRKIHVDVGTGVIRREREYLQCVQREAEDEDHREDGDNRIHCGRGVRIAPVMYIAFDDGCHKMDGKEVNAL